MKEQRFVIGDVHGEYEMLEKLLTFWDESQQDLIFIGDLTDRGENSLQVLERVRQLVEEGRALCLRGNHEEMLRHFLQQPEKKAALYMMNGGLKTIESIVGKDLVTVTQAHVMAEAVMTQLPWLAEFIENLPYYIEWQNYVFVHAGVDLTLDDWKMTQPHEFIWIRQPFHEGENRTGKTIVFGHTPTPSLHQDESQFQIWQSDHKIGIDGGAVFGGILHGLVLDKTGIVHHYGVQKDDNGLIQATTYQ
ncbi:metallophosphoesterase [Jeotgalibaca arthritidis]|uniref:Serine/threonine protein phosphatase n=1 Tax=Jeotgalibaca arthritidis TaxID=1868794 RepID=A0A6G7K7B6_9LACT|nr:metallophosphoesterase [Jeotgalibaca arthritidis]QII81154.1 serine/threonine protein phosphatase [Jeotgalibaca arthritidis]